MCTKFTNERRACGRTTEGHGEYRTVWTDYEIKCPDCGRWTTRYGEYSVTNSDGTESWVCDDCGIASFYGSAEIPPDDNRPCPADSPARMMRCG